MSIAQRLLPRHGAGANIRRELDPTVGCMSAQWQRSALRSASGCHFNFASWESHPDDVTCALCISNITRATPCCARVDSAMTEFVPAISYLGILGILFPIDFETICLCKIVIKE